MIDQIRKMTEQGFAARKIGLIIKMDAEEVKTIIRENGFHMTKEPFNNDLIPSILELYKSGVSAKNLGIKYSIGKGRILDWAERKGFKRSKEEAGRLYPFNKNIFDCIDTPAKAYWLGFLYADAYNYENRGWLSIGLSAKDEDQLHKYVEFMELKNYEVRKSQMELTYDGATKQYPTCAVKINSRYLSKRMHDLGCPQAKSFIITYPAWLDTNLNSHFIRGMFDGDGSLCVMKANKEWHWNLVSTDVCCQSIQNIIFANIGIRIKFDSISQTGHNTCGMSQRGNERVLKIMDWLYKDATPDIYLERKHQKYLALIDQQNNRAFLKLTNRKTYNIYDSLTEETKSEIIEDIDNDLEMDYIVSKYKISESAFHSVAEEET